MAGIAEILVEALVRSGPIDVILDPGFDHWKYRELPFHSSLCSSCSEVYPVRINLAEQIYQGRRVIANEELLPTEKAAGMAVMGQVLAHETAFHAVEAVGIADVKYLASPYSRQPLQPLDEASEDALHEAYNGKLDLAETAYGMFMAGSSATGDVESVIVHGAQAARSITVLLPDEQSSMQ